MSVAGGSCAVLLSELDLEGGEVGCAAPAYLEGWPADTVFAQGSEQDAWEQERL